MEKDRRYVLRDKFRNASHSTKVQTVGTSFYSQSLLADYFGDK